MNPRRTSVMLNKILFLAAFVAVLITAIVPPKGRREHARQP
jgi:hypothetical protein